MVTDLAVGAGKDDDGGTDRGAVWVLFMNTDGTVKSHQKISNTQAPQQWSANCIGAAGVDAHRRDAAATARCGRWRMGLGWGRASQAAALE